MWFRGRAMKPHTDHVVERPGDLTADWLTAAVGAGNIADFSVERIGTGQMSECYRVGLTYADSGSGSGRPDSVVLKVAATDPMSRQTGGSLGLYEREVCFYRDIAPRLHGPVAPCYHVAFDASAGIFDVLLGDANPAVVGDEIRGATIEQARLAVTELARLQGPLLGDTTLADTPWLTRETPVSQGLITALYAAFDNRYGDRIAPQHRMVCERLVGGFDAYLAEEAAEGRIQGLVHGDYRLDNMLFGADGADRPLTVVDWQTVTWGPAMTDLAYFVGCALPAAERRTHYDALLQAYHAALGPDAPISLDDVRDGVRRQSFFGVMMAIVSSMLVERTERGDAMFMTMLQRHCEHVLDVDALATLPDPMPIEPLRPSHDDESAHIATDDPWSLHTDAVDFTHSADDPLQTYRIGLHGHGESYPDPAMLLRRERGTPVEVALDLAWSTDGTPYKYRLTTRYEIPCTVSGTVSVDGRRYTVDSVPGQRDHSWGVRDWWSMDWVWSALHLDDGTHIHAADIRIPGVPPVGIGYVQDRAGTLTELQSIAARQTFGADGLPASATLAVDPGGITATVDMRGHAPVLLVSRDGRTSQFPRVWATISTADGRQGVGWLEWNRNLS